MSIHYSECVKDIAEVNVQGPLPGVCNGSMSMSHIGTGRMLARCGCELLNFFQINMAPGLVSLLLIPCASFCTSTASRTSLISEYG